MQVRMREPSGGRLAQTGVELSREARVRLAWMDFYRPAATSDAGRAAIPERPSETAPTGGRAASGG